MPGTSHSFELYPPRTARSAAALPAALEALAATGPEYFSVTYGASGSSTEASFDLVRQVADRTDVDVMAHLTCSCASVAGTAQLVRRLLDAGASRFLAVRGDPVEGATAGGLRSAAELVQLIHRVQAERATWGRRLPGPAGVGGTGPSRARVAVAAFVNGHPDSRGRTDHLDALLAKQIAGADLAITQLFFHPEDYAAFVDRARRWGITIPIVPGVLPVTSPARLTRMLELSGEDEPNDLAIALEVEPTDEGRHEIGVAHAARFAQALLDAGAPALHLYTFNRADAVVAVLERLGLAPAPIKETT
ncbi:methylenetetrahydrofolate reductase [uncultured Amnibacterium sp.]|uniref:methylenetetrahydrofolate reductase n=1 Tax=uncultured Amnibacterium sp. TaxID=1631851 RepID=UPI0035CAD4F7